MELVIVWSCLPSGIRVDFNYSMKNATLQQLRVFETAARYGSFTRAAEELFLTQPTVSMQIKQLTKAVGMPLFEQVGKRLYLTTAGKELFETCREVFEKLNQFEMTVADLKGLKQGRLRLAVITTAKYVAPRILAPFCQRYQGIDVSLKVTNHERLIDRIVQNLDDLYIISHPPESLDVSCHPFLENPLVVVASADHPLAGEKNISIKQLTGQSFIMREPGSGTREAAQKLLEKFGVLVNVRLELGSNEAIKQAIAVGLGISVLSRHTLTMDTANSQITILDVEGFPIRRYWYVLYPNGKQLSVVARAFFEYLMDEGRQMATPF